MHKNAIFAAAFGWAVTAVPLAAFPERRAGIPGLPDVSAVTDGRELFDGSQANGPRPPAVPAMDALTGSGAGVDHGLKTAGGRYGRQEGLNIGAETAPAPAAGTDSQQAGSEGGFCNGSFREFDQRVGKVPVLGKLFSIILQPVVVYCTLMN